MAKDSTTNHANHHEQENILFKEECFEIYGCIYAVNRKLGVGFLEAVSKINNQHKAQLMNYMVATGFKLGLLVNFNENRDLKAMIDKNGQTPYDGLNEVG